MSGIDHVSVNTIQTCCQLSSFQQVEHLCGKTVVDYADLINIPIN